MPENDADNQVILFGETTFRNKNVRFGIKRDDRRRHMYTIGKTGMGKSFLLELLALQDIQHGDGVAFVDPHGESAEKLLDYVPASRIKDVIYFDPSDLQYPIAFNVMERVHPEFRHLVASGLMGVFKKIWPDVWSARMEYILNNTILALLEKDDSTLLGVNRMFADKEYRSKVVQNLQDLVVKAFWTKEFAGYGDRLAAEATAAIQNKVGQFTTGTLVRNIIGQVHSTLNMREIMDSGKILIANISKGKIGEDASKLLGALLVTKLQLAAMSRVDIPRMEDRRDFFLYVDELQNFATDAFANILSEARKYRLNLIMAHQYVAQIPETVRDAVFGNIGTIVTFRVGADDAEFLEKEFAPEFTASDIVNLAKRNVYVKLLIDGVSSRPFSAQTISLPFPQSQSHRQEIIDHTRATYAVERKEVEESIAQWAGVTLSAKPQKPQSVPHNTSQAQQTQVAAKKKKKPEMSVNASAKPQPQQLIQNPERRVQKEQYQEHEKRDARAISKTDHATSTKEPDLEGLRDALKKALGG